jgi:hypothetical protein
MIKNLIKIAAELDAKGFAKEADIVDLIIRKVAQTNVGDYDPGLALSDEERSDMFGGSDFGGTLINEETGDFREGASPVELTEEDLDAMSDQAELDAEADEWEKNNNLYQQMMDYHGATKGQKGNSDIYDESNKYELNSFLRDEMLSQREENPNR